VSVAFFLAEGKNSRDSPTLAPQLERPGKIQSKLLDEKSIQPLLKPVQGN
jgi:hypothetical protein